MKQRKKLDLKELELQLPSIDLNETRIILGGNDYGDNLIGHMEDGDFVWYTDGGTNDGGNNNVGGNNATGDNIDAGDLDHYYDGDNAGDWDLDYDVNGDGVNGENYEGNINDGFDLENYDNLIIDTGNPTFDQAIENILGSNSELANLLEELLADGTNEIKFSISDLGNGQNGEYKLAETTHDNNYSSYEITFNSNSFDQYGDYIYDGQGISSDSTDLKELTPQEELAVNIAHELLHVGYQEMLKDAYDNMVTNQQGLNELANDLINNHGADFRDAYMYFDGNDWQWRDINDPVQNDIFNDYIHDYMKDHDSDFIKNVLDEFRKDF